MASVHPRGCGEHGAAIGLGIGWYGSSPRVRGTRYRNSRERENPRFIPAGAGNTRPTAGEKCSVSVHPRGCGEHPTPFLSVAIAHGSSPRVRGTRSYVVPSGPVRRFIPAGAGNTNPPIDRVIAVPVHPRGCGEHTGLTRPLRRSCGSSPRVRGTRRGLYSTTVCRRFIPAGAGNTFAIFLSVPSTPVHPRGCGEHRCAGTSPSNASGSSPRVRGTPLRNADEPAPCRFIPAGAGNTSPTAPKTPPATVHPRGCGEHQR